MHYKTVRACGNLTKVGTTHPCWFTPPLPFEEAYDWLKPALLTTYLELYNFGEKNENENVSEYCSRTDKSTAAPGRQPVKNYVTSDIILFWTDKRPILRIYFFYLLHLRTESQIDQ